MSKVTCERNLARTEHVLIVKVYVKRKKWQVFIAHVQDSFQKPLSTATFERKLYSVSLDRASAEDCVCVINYIFTYSPNC